MARNAIAFEVSGADHPDARKAGAYWFIEYKGSRTGIGHACPCGCGAAGVIWFQGGTWTMGEHWTVEGEWPKATLSPSIGFGRLKAGGYHWHGYLRNGVFEEC